MRFGRSAAASSEPSRVAVPYIEILLGLALLIGFYVRPAALIVIGTMVVATYVHLVVDDPSLFPLQPSAPIIPTVVIAGAVFLLVKGGGAWSLDLKAADTFKQSCS